MEDLHFVIFSCGYNCEKYIPTHIKSVDAQAYKNWQHIIVDDASTDDTFIQSALHLGPQRAVFQNEKNIKWIPNALKYLDPWIQSEEDIIVLLDADDWLYANNVLNVVYDVYKKTDCWMTSSLFLYMSNGTMSNWIPKYTEEDYLFKNYRNHTWSFTHLRTFKAFLWNALDKNDLKGPDGQYAKYSYDRALLYPMLEMSSPNKIQYIDKVLYCYNDTNPLQVEKTHRREQEDILKYFNNKPKYRRLKR